MGRENLKAGETALNSKPVVKAKSTPIQPMKHPILQMQQIIGNRVLVRIIQRQTTPPESQPAAPTGNSSIVDNARKRSAGDIGTAYNWSPGWWYTPNSNLADWRSKPLKWEKAQDPPSGEGIVNWGDGQFTCNIFVYDTLFAAGYNPPLHSNKHYYDATQTYNQEGALKTYFKLITDPSQVAPGDVMTTGIHMEIVSSAIDKNKFWAFGGHVDGAYETSKTYNNSMRFYRVI